MSLLFITHDPTSIALVLTTIIQAIAWLSTCLLISREAWRLTDWPGDQNKVFLASATVVYSLQLLLVAYHMTFVPGSSPAISVFSAVFSTVLPPLLLVFAQTKGILFTQIEQDKNELDRVSVDIFDSSDLYRNGTSSMGMLSSNVRGMRENSDDDDNNKNLYNVGIFAEMRRLSNLLGLGLERYSQLGQQDADGASVLSRGASDRVRSSDLGRHGIGIGIFDEESSNRNLSLSLSLSSSGMYEEEDEYAVLDSHTRSPLVLSAIEKHSNTVASNFNSNVHNDNYSNSNSHNHNHSTTKPGCSIDVGSVVSPGSPIKSGSSVVSGRIQTSLTLSSPGSIVSSASSSSNRYVRACVYIISFLFYQL